MTVQIMIQILRQIGWKIVSHADELRKPCLRTRARRFGFDRVHAHRCPIWQINSIWQHDFSFGNFADTGHTKPTCGNSGYCGSSLLCERWARLRNEKKPNRSTFSTPHGVGAGLYALNPVKARGPDGALRPQLPEVGERNQSYSRRNRIGARAVKRRTLVKVSESGWQQATRDAFLSVELYRTTSFGGNRGAQPAACARKSRSRFGIESGVQRGGLHSIIRVESGHPRGSTTSATI